MSRNRHCERCHRLLEWRKRMGRHSEYEQGEATYRINGAEVCGDCANQPRWIGETLAMLNLKRSGA